MSLDALLARLEGRPVTSVTADITPDVTPKPASVKACTCVTSVTAGNEDTENKVNGEPLFDPATDSRRQRMLAMLTENPTARYALATDAQADPEGVILSLAIRDRATCELRIPREKYDGVLLLDLIERHGATVH